MFGAVKLTRNADDALGRSSLSDGSAFGKNIIIFGIDTSSSVGVNKGKEDIKILGKGSTQGLEDTKLASKKEYSINFSEQHKKIYLLLHDNGVNSYIFFMVSKYLN